MILIGNIDADRNRMTVLSFVKFRPPSSFSFEELEEDDDEKLEDDDEAEDSSFFPVEIDTVKLLPRPT